MKKSILIPALTLVFASLFAMNLNGQTPSFQDFLAQFPTASLPYSLDAQSLQAKITGTAATEKAKRMSWEYYEFLPELERSAEFSGMPVHPEPVAKFENGQYYAVLYNLARGFSKGSKTYSISLFDKQGAYVSTHFVAGVNANEITAVMIDAQLKATVSLYRLNDAGAPTQQAAQTFDLFTEGNPDQLEWTAAPVKELEMNQVSTMVVNEK